MTRLRTANHQRAVDTGRDLAEHRAPRAERGAQRLLHRRGRRVEGGAEHADRSCPVLGAEHAGVGGRVDAERQARHHHDTGPSQLGPELRRHLAPVGGGGARPHHRHPGPPLEHADVAGGEQDGRRLTVLGQSGRVPRMPEDHDGGVAPLAGGGDLFEGGGHGLGR